MLKKLLFFGVLTLMLQSCYYDKEDVLYRTDCDTTNVTYSQTIQPIINSSCSGCHSTSNPSGGLVLENYSQVKTIVDDGRLVNSIYGTNGYNVMPKGAKLSDCNINQVNIWIKNGAKNN